ncbi:MAG: hypothetical protein A2Y33_16415 [Spirochaetes bacterium GWF1_51_8]|nr:MAG: hypothetical protein A2Y33_16415 [Spirochaetes bacterium GWF1_51_8]
MKVKRWIEDHKIPFIPVAVIVLIAGIAAYFLIRFIFLSGMEYTFYYPDLHFQKMSSEPRAIYLDPVTEYFEKKLVQDYFLGPLKYELRMPIDDDLQVTDIWFVDDGKTKGIVINFADKLNQYIKERNDSVVWLIQGLVMTLKANTGVKHVILLERGNRIPEGVYIGKWQPAFPIPVE